MQLRVLGDIFFWEKIPRLREHEQWQISYTSFKYNNSINFCIYI